MAMHATLIAHNSAVSVLSSRCREGRNPSERDRVQRSETREREGESSEERESEGESQGWRQGGAGAEGMTESTRQERGRECGRECAGKSLRSTSECVSRASDKRRREDNVK